MAGGDRLYRIRRTINRHDICAAVNQLEAFWNEIEAQREKKISNEAADLLIAYADNLLTKLLLDLPPGRELSMSRRRPIPPQTAGGRVIPVTSP